MPDVKDVIKGLEEMLEDSKYNDSVNWNPWADTETLEDAIALLKTQEPEAMDAPKPDSDIECWYDITHNYTLEQVISALKAQEPRVMAGAELTDAELIEKIRKAPITLKPAVDAVPHDVYAGTGDRLDHAALPRTADRENHFCDEA